MAPRKRASNASNAELQAELDLITRKYLKLKQKYKDLAMSSDEDSSDEEVKQQPTKKRRKSEKPSMDPLTMLNPDCFEEVLKYLKPKELLECKLVSKSWKNYIEMRTSLMKRFVVNMTSTNVKRMKIKSLDKILQSERAYKHMKAEFKVHHKIFRFPLQHRAATLETLELTCVQWDLGDFEPKPLEFPVLKKLVIICSRSCTHKHLMNFIEASKFPELTHFKTGRFGDKKLDTFINNFPKLRVFTFTVPQTTRINEAWQKDISTIKGPPKIETIGLQAYLTFFVRIFKDTLTELYVDVAKSSDIADILGSLKKLEQLTIRYVDIQTRWFVPRLPSHENLKTLKVGINEFNDFLCSFLKALPSLNVLISSFEITEDFIRFLASNMKKLSTVSSRVQSSVLEYYDKLKMIGNAQLNTSFIIQNKGNYFSYQFDFERSHFD